MYAVVSQYKIDFMSILLLLLLLNDTIDTKLCTKLHF